MELFYYVYDISQMKIAREQFDLCTGFEATSTLCSTLQSNLDTLFS